MARTTLGLICSAGALPAERTWTSLAARWWRRAAANVLRDLALPLRERLQTLPSETVHEDGDEIGEPRCRQALERLLDASTRAFDAAVEVNSGDRIDL
jgi:hypothetical protein